MRSVQMNREELSYTSEYWTADKNPNAVEKKVRGGRIPTKNSAIDCSRIMLEEHWLVTEGEYSQQLEKGGYNGSAPSSRRRA